MKGTRNEKVESRRQTVCRGNEPPRFSYFSDAAIDDSGTTSTLDTPTPTRHCPPTFEGTKTRPLTNYIMRAQPLTYRTTANLPATHHHYVERHKNPIACMSNDTNAWRIECRYFERHGDARSPSPLCMDDRTLPSRTTKEPIARILNDTNNQPV